MAAQHKGENLDSEKLKGNKFALKKPEDRVKGTPHVVKTQARINHLHKCIYNDIVHGVSYDKIHHKLLTDGYGIGKRYGLKRSDQHIQAVQEIIRESFEKDKPYLKEKLLACFLDIYQAARDKGDLRTSVDAIKELAKLANIYEDNRQSLNIKTKDTEVTISFGINNNNEADINDVEIEEHHIEEVEAEVIEDK